MSDLYYSYRRDLGKLNIVIDNVHYFVTKNETEEDAFDKLLELCREYNKTSDPKLLIMIHQLARYGKDFSNFKGFDYDKYKIFLEDTNIPLPKALVNRLQDASEDEIESLKAFWANSILNPDPKARDGFFLYTQNFMSPITRNGYVVMYKAVKRVNKELFYPPYFVNYIFDKLNTLRSENPILRDKSDDKVIHTFFEINDDIHGFLLCNDHVEDITTPHLIDRIKQVYASGEDENMKMYIAKKIWDHKITSLEQCPSVEELMHAENLKADTFDVKDFLYDCDLVSLYKDDAYNVITMDDFQKNYRHLYDTIPDYDYTPHHQGNTGMEIRLGQPVKMDRYQVDACEDHECSYGLHVGSYEYVKHFAEKDSVILMCLVNPRNVVAIPKYDTSKIRVCEYIPIAEIQRRDDGTWDQLESNFSEIDYINYEKVELENLLQSGINTDKPEVSDIKYIKSVLDRRNKYIQGLNA